MHRTGGLPITGMHHEMDNTDKIPQRVLIIGPSWVGDMMMAQSLFMVLQARFPGIHIDVMAPNWSAPLLAAMPQVSGTLEMPLGHGQVQLAQRYRLGRALVANAYDWSIVLPNSFKSALIPFWAKIPRRSGYLGEMRLGLLNQWRRLDKTKLSMTVQRFCNLAFESDDAFFSQYATSQDLPYPQLAVDTDAAAAKLKTSFPALFSYTEHKADLLILAPGAEYGPAKQWPARYFSAIAKRFMQSTSDARVVLLGSAKDQAISQRINQRCDSRLIDLSGKTTLQQAMQIMSLGRAAVSNDSGLMHLAAAVGIPVVGIYGSSDPGFTPPLSRRASGLSLHLECSPCFKRECPLGHLDCLEKLTPDRVWMQLEEILEA